MTTHQQVASAALDNQAFALMSRMHVILRRQNGRITDIEYMRIDPAYCRYLLDMAWQLPNDDLHRICDKLQEIFFGQEGIFMRAQPKPPLLMRLGTPVTATDVPHAGTTMRPQNPLLEQPASLAAESDVIDCAYIGRLR